MPEIQTQALVLRSFDQGESDRLVRLFTERCGRVSAIAKGAKRSRRRFPGTLESLTIAEVRLVAPARSSLMRLESARLSEPYEGLIEDVRRYGIACQLLELLDRLTGENEAHPGLYRFARGALGALRREAPDRLLALLLRTKVLAWLGYRPELRLCTGCGRSLEGLSRCGFEARQGGAVCPGCAEFPDALIPTRLMRALEQGIRSPLSARQGLALSAAHIRIVEQHFERFARFHTGVELRSSGFLEWALGALDASPSPVDTSREPAQRVQVQVSERTPVSTGSIAPSRRSAVDSHG